MEQLIENLRKLDNFLQRKNKEITLHLIGGMALHLHGINIGRVTQDWDSVKEVSDDEIISNIHEIAEASGLEKWFDLGASSISLPDNYESRLIEYKDIKLSNIKIYLLSKKDIVLLKVAAYHNRSVQGVMRDLDDLKNLAPSKDLIDEAIEFTYEKYSQDLAERFKKSLRKDLEDVKEEILNALK